MINKFFKLIIITFIYIYLINCTLSSSVLNSYENENSFELLLIHTNDIHAHISQYTRLGQICNPQLSHPKNEKCIGGIPRLENSINEVLSQRNLSFYDSKDKDQYLLLNAGDEFQGTLYFNVYQGNASAEFMNSINYDAFVLGNHEFDSGPNVLAQYIEQLRMPVLCANMNYTRDEYISRVAPHHLFPYTIVTKKGQRIAIIGVTVEDIPSLSQPGPDLEFLDPFLVMQEQIDRLRRNENIDKVVALTHIGYSRDQQLAAQVKGIDVIVGGHSHTYLGPNGRGPYPTMVQDPEGHDVCIVQAKCWGTYLGVLDVVWDNDGNIKQCRGEPMLMAHDLPQNETIEERVEDISEPVIKMMKEPVGTLEHDLPQDHCEHRECALGDVVADAITAAARQHASSSSLLLSSSSKTISRMISSISIGVRTLFRRAIFTESSMDSLSLKSYNNNNNNNENNNENNENNNNNEFIVGGFVNGGGLRTGIPQGSVSWGSILSCMPFGNHIRVASVRGSVLYEMIEYSLSHLPQGFGGFLQVSQGFQIRYQSVSSSSSSSSSLSSVNDLSDKTNPSYIHHWNNKENHVFPDVLSNPERKHSLEDASPEFELVSFHVKNGEGDWEPVQHDQMYRVAMSGFTFKGGDGYDMIAPNATRVTELGMTTVAYATRDYFEAQSPIDMKMTEQRIALASNHDDSSSDQSNGSNNNNNDDGSGEPSMVKPIFYIIFGSLFAVAILFGIFMGALYLVQRARRYHRMNDTSLADPMMTNNDEEQL